MKKCFICGQQYDPDKIESFSFREHQNLHTVSEIQIKDKKIPLCNTCFRQIMLIYCIYNHYDIEIEDEEIEITWV